MVLAPVMQPGLGDTRNATLRLQKASRDQTAPHDVQLKLYLRVDPLLHMQHQFLHSWRSQLAFCGLSIALVRRSAH